MARVAGPWTALFPLTYCLHVAEEYWGGETFYGWVSRLWSIDFTREEFLTLNAIAMGVMIAGTLAANLTPARWPIAALGFVTAANGLLHTIASIATALLLARPLIRPADLAAARQLRVAASAPGADPD